MQELRKIFNKIGDTEVIEYLPLAFKMADPNELKEIKII